ncbi:Ubiquinone hydroxylase UbiL [Azospirillaceae bacterium]
MFLGSVDSSGLKIMNSSPFIVGDELITDVVIVGGGLAGLTLACALGGAGVPTVCVDRDSPKTQTTENFDIRTTAVSFSSQQVLAAAGVWNDMVNGAAAINDIRVADKDSPFFVHYNFQEVGDHPLGWVLDNIVMRRALFARVAELPALTHLAPATVAQIERSPAGAVTVLTDGRRIRSRLIVGADGRPSLCRRLAGIGVMRYDYGQNAIVCTIGHEKPHHGLAVEHFLPAGPFALLPLPDNRTSIVWSERRALAPTYVSLPDDQFLYELQRRAGDHLGALHLVGGRTHYPLSIMFAERHIDQRLALIGEAAHAIHPIAGQGLNMGLRDVAALAETVVDCFRLGLDVGAPGVLTRYQQWRRFDNTLLAVVCDSLVRLFSNNFPPLRIARNLGLGAVQQLPPLKQFFMKHAMGVVGECPRMTRGEPV